MLRFCRRQRQRSAYPTSALGAKRGKSQRLGLPASHGASAQIQRVSRQDYLQPAGVNVLPGGQAGLGAGFAGDGGGGGLTAAAAAGIGRGGGFGFTACGDGVAPSVLAPVFDGLGGPPLFSFAWPSAGPFLSDVLEPA